MSKTILTSTLVSGSITSTGSFGDIRLVNPTGHSKILSNDSLVLGAKSVVSVNIDYDGNQTDRAFIVRNNTDLATGGTELFRVNEDGNSIFAGDVSSSVASTASFGALRVEAEEDGTTITTDRFGLTIDGQVGWYPLTVQSPFETAARFKSTDGTAAISIGDNSSTDNYNRIQVVGDGRMEFFVNNQEIIKLAPGGSATVFNEDSLDINFRFEGADDENLFYLDAGKNHATIGAARGNTGDEKLLVAGDVGITGSLHVSGNISTSGSIIAKEFRTEFVNQIIATSSGSTTFGDSVDDIHRFTGSLEVSSSINIADSPNTGLAIGNSDDLQIYHNGTNSFGADNYTGHLIFQNRADDSDIIFKSDDGSGGVTSYFYLDGSSTKTVFAQSTQHADNAKATFGAAGDMEIYHDGSNSVINNTTGHLQIYNNVNDADIVLLSDDGSGGTTAYFTADGSDVRNILHEDTHLLANKKLAVGNATPSYSLSIVSPSTAYALGDAPGAHLESATDHRLLFKVKNTNSNTGASAPRAGFDLEVQNHKNDTVLRAILDLKQMTAAGGGGETSLTVPQHFSVLVNNSASLFETSGALESNSTPGGTEAFRVGLTGDIGINATNKLYFDGVNGAGHTYITEEGADNIGIYAGGTRLLQLVEGGTNYVATGDNTLLGVGNDVDLFMRHNGTNSHIINSVGELHISQSAQDKDIKFSINDGGNIETPMRIEGSTGAIHIGQPTRFQFANDQRIYDDSGGGLAVGAEAHKLTLYGGSSTSKIEFLTGGRSGTKRVQIDDYGMQISGSTTSGRGVLDIEVQNGTYTDMDTAVRITNTHAEAEAGLALNTTGDALSSGITHNLTYDDNNPRQPNSGRTSGYITFVGNATSGTNSRIALGGAPEGGNVTSAYMPDRLVLDFDGNTKVLSGSLIVSESIGIKTGSPSADLEVNGTSNFTGVMYIDHGGSDYSPNISFMGGSNTPGSNTYENAIIGYYDNSGTGNMLFKGNRGSMNWHFNDDGDSLFLMASSGDFHANGDVIAASTTTSSDIRLKKNVNDISYGLSEVLQLRGVEFDWKEKRDGKHDIGVIAQEIEKIIPEVVQESKDLNSDTMYKSVDYGKLTAVLVEAVKEQQVQIEELKEDIKKLRGNK